MAFIDDVKQWFETGDYPTQEQFYQLFEKLFFKDEKIAIASVDGLSDILNSIGSQPAIAVTMSEAKSFTIPAGYCIYKIYVDTDYPASSFFIGDLPGDSNLLDAVDIVKGTTLPVTIDIVANADRVIWFNVPVVTLSQYTRLKIYLQKI